MREQHTDGFDTPNTVVQLVPNNALCVNQEDLAQRLERLADAIREGEFEALDRIVVLLDMAGAAIDNRCYGRPTTNMELVGLLQYAQYNVMHSVE